jgi:signal transduction histidine kinase
LSLDTTPSALDRLLQPTRWLLAISILLPAALLGLAAWQGYHDALREAQVRVERNSRVLHEHAVKVFETHKLVIDEVNSRLMVLDLSKPDDAKDLHDLLARIQDEFDQVATITITDAAGRMIGSGRTFPADPSISFADRDWFQALKERDYKTPYISRSYTGRQSGQSVFNVAQRIRGANPASFYGAIAVSVDRKYFEDFYRDVEPAYEEHVALFRDDGVILAQQPSVGELTFPAGQEIAAAVNLTPDRYVAGSSVIDGDEQIAGFRKVGDYPIIAAFEISRDSALASWRVNLFVYALLGILASMSLLAVSAMAIREANKERLATERWREAANNLTAEADMRGKVETQLRQAQKMEAVGRLTGGVAHDFNNLLTVVIGSLDLLGRRLADGDERMRSLVRNALEASRRAAALTSRLLAFSRQQPLAPSAIDVNKLISGMSDLVRRTLGEQIEIEVVLAGGLWPAHADTNQLEAAILNLAVNARDAMPDGGKMTVETANSHLDDAYAADHSEVHAGQYVVICISDTGTGMAAHVIANAFEPFFTTKPVGKGTGLGLSQVYGFAKQSGGHAAIYSERGEGTTVKIYLPRYRGAIVEPPAVEPTMIPVAPANGETVLVVEDEAAVRDFSAAALRDSGYRVLEAPDAEHALQIISQHDDIAVLFTDIVLTGAMNGRKLADAIKKLRPDMPVLFTTGYTRNAIIHHGRLDEGIAFIGKPFTAQALAAKISEVLRNGGQS